MANPKVKFKRSSVAGKSPGVGDLPLGELAINTHDGRVYTSKSTDGGITTSIVNVSGIQLIDETTAIGFANTVTFSGDGVVSTVQNGVGIVTIVGSQWLTTNAGIHTLSNVGIGTTNPTSNVDVLGKIQIGQNVTSDNRLIFRGQPDSSYRWNIDNYGSSNEFRIFREDDATSSNGVVRLSISTTGTVTAAKFSGDGSLLTGIVASGSGIVILDDMTFVGTASTINFGGNLNVSPISSGIVTVSITDDVSISGILTANSFRARGGSPGGFGVNNNGYGFFGSGDNDSGMYSSADGQIEFYSNSSEVARIAAGGNVGIATTNPTSKLDVIGDVKISGLTTTNNLNVTGVGTFLSSGLVIRNPANTFQYNITGGAISADRTLNLPVITGTDTLATLGLTQTFTGDKSFSGNIAATGALILFGSTTANHSFATNQTSGTLTFGGTSGTGLITFGRATTSQTTDIQAGATASGNTKTINLGTGGLSGSFTDIEIGPTAGIGTVLINAGTNLGINTATPGAKLHVTPTSTSIAGLFSGTTSSDMVRITQLGSGNALVVEDETNPDSTPFVVTGIGSVGIGITNPTVRLDVVGDVKITGVITATSFSGNASSATYATTAGYASTAGIATVSQGLTGSPNITVSSVNSSGIVTGSTFRPSTGYIQAADGTNSLYIYDSTGNVAFQGTIGASQINNGQGFKVIGFSGTNNASFENHLYISGITTSVGGFVGNLTGTATNATYATTAGVSTDVIGGIASVTQLNVSGVSTLGTSNISGDLTFTGNNDIYLKDGGAINFGDGNDLQIFHNGSVSVIRDGGTGGLLIDSDNEVKIAKNGTGNDNLAVFTPDGSVELYYDNSKKFETTGVGATVFGILQTQGLNSSGVITATSFSGNASSATALQNARTFEITGDVLGSAVSFDGTGNVSIAATIQPNSVGLGTDTTGDYVQSITGTSNQITVTSGTGEGSTPTLSVPNQFTAPQDVTVSRDLQVNRNLNVNGNITIGGTAATLFAADFKVYDPDLVLGFRTDGNGNDISTDNTANHGGIAVASTEGNPLIQLFDVGIGETNPATYKKFMWFKAGTFAGLGTDAWLSNYAIGIGSTQVPNGVRLAAGGMQVTDSTISSPQLSITGVSTFTNGPILVGSSSSTGTASQPLQVTGGAYVSGSVGIGTTNPNQLLHLNSSSSNQVVINLQNSNTGGNAWLLQSSGGSSNIGQGNFSIYDSNTGQYRLIINSSGNLGIGTTNPGATLQVTPTSTSIAGLFSGTTSSDMVRITQLGTGNALVVEDSTNPDATPFVVGAAGSVGIGTINPTTKLQVGGVIGFNDTNIKIGDNTTGASITSGTNNNFIGVGAGNANQGGSSNNFFGVFAGFSNQSGSNNIFLGNGAGYSNNSGSQSVFLGLNAGLNNSSGGSNNFFGVAAGISNQTGSNNIFLGARNGISASASYKVILGSGYLTNYFDSPNTTKDYQFAVGIRTDANASKYWLVGDENFNVGIGTTIFTGTASQPLQVTGGAYVSGNLGVGNTNPQYNIHVIGTADPAGMFFDAYGNVAANIAGRRANGTLASPTGVTTNNNLLVLQGGGYTTGSAFADAKAAIFMQASEVWTSTAQGSHLDFATTLPGTTTRSNKVRIDGYGNVLVGTSSSTGTASQPLQVTGGGYFSGSVGIGTTNPISPFGSAGLHLFGTNGLNIQSVAPNIFLQETDNSNNYYNLVVDAGVFGVRYNNSFPGALQVNQNSVLVGTATSTGTASQPLQVTGGAYVSGNLGVGVTNPSTFKLDVNGLTKINHTGTEQLTVQGSGGGYFFAGYDNANNRARIGSYKTGWTDLLINEGGSNVIIGSSSSTGTTSQPLQVTGGAYVSGNLGVGVTNPSTKLDVAGTIRLRRNDSSFEGGEIQFARAVDDALAFIFDVYGNTAANSRLRLFSGVTGSEIFTVDTSNNFIIGAATSTGTASQRLQVTGGAYVSGSVGIGRTNPSTALDVNGTVTCIDINSTSDANLKDNVQTFENALDIIKDIRGVRFEWKENRKQSVGVIAQEVEKVLPELVSDTNPKTVNYNGLIGVLIEAIKEQQTQINTLKEEIQSLKK